MEEKKGMIYPALFEDAMQDYEQQMQFHCTDKEAVRRKAIDDVVHVLNQFGYSAGAEIFDRIFKNKIDDVTVI